MTENQEKAWENCIEWMKTVPDLGYPDWEKDRDAILAAADELTRLRAANEKLQEELEAAACQLGAMDAELKRLEEERLEYRAKYLSAMNERDGYKYRAEQRMALRAELETLLGFNVDATYDPKEFEKAVEKVREMKERAEKAEAALRVIEAKLDDREGMAKAIYKFDPVINRDTREISTWDDLTNRYRELYMRDADSIIKWMKEG